MMRDERESKLPLFFAFLEKLCYNIIKIKSKEKNMKILVDEMPTKVENCPWSSPIKEPWKDRTFWFCDWSLSYNETCPMANGGECFYFATIKKGINL